MKTRTKLPPKPVAHGEAVIITRTDGTKVNGTANCLGYCPFPGFWSYEFIGSDGVSYGRGVGMTAYKAVEV